MTADQINHPPHYNHGAIEPISVIEDWRLGFRLGNCIKYIARADHKGTPVQDLKKALWYLTREKDTSGDQKAGGFMRRPMPGYQAQDVIADWKLNERLAQVVTILSPWSGHHSGLLEKAIAVLGEEIAAREAGK